MKFRSISVFIVSLMASIAVLGLQRLVGIEWDFHPDAVTYTSTYEEMTEALVDAGFLSFFNNFYYVIAWIFNGNISALIGLNVIVYALTNVFLASIFHRYAKQAGLTGVKYLFLLVLLLFTPYRLHLSVHILKDTLIIACFCVIAAKVRASYFAWFFILLLRVFSLLYAAIFVPRKWLIFGVICLLILVVGSSEISLFLASRNEIDMTFREFDSVPTFSELGGFGIVLRALVWPFFVLSGIFFVLSPSVVYLPVALGSVMLQIWSRMLFKTWAFTLGAYAVMSLLALLVTGFTSYIRYCYPIIVVMPILLMQLNSALHGRRKNIN